MALNYYHIADESLQTLHFIVPDRGVLRQGLQDIVSVFSTRCGFSVPVSRMLSSLSEPGFRHPSLIRAKESCGWVFSLERQGGRGVPAGTVLSVSAAEGAGPGVVAVRCHPGTIPGLLMGPLSLFAVPGPDGRPALDCLPVLDGERFASMVESDVCSEDNLGLSGFELLIEPYGRKKACASLLDGTSVSLSVDEAASRIDALYPGFGGRVYYRDLRECSSQLDSLLPSRESFIDAVAARIVSDALSRDRLAWERAQEEPSYRKRFLPEGVSEALETESSFIDMCRREGTVRKDVSFGGRDYFGKVRVGGMLFGVISRRRWAGREGLLPSRYAYELVAVPYNPVSFVSRSTAAKLDGVGMVEALLRDDSAALKAIAKVIGKTVSKKESMRKSGVRTVL